MGRRISFMCLIAATVAQTGWIPNASATSTWDDEIDDAGEFLINRTPGFSLPSDAPSGDNPEPYVKHQSEFLKSVARDLEDEGAVSIEADPAPSIEF